MSDGMATEIAVGNAIDEGGYTMARKLWITTSAAVLLWCGAAQAQDAQTAGSANDEQATTLGEVVVTAERRTTNLQTTAVAASVLSGEDLQNKGVSNIETLQFSVPSVTVQNSGQGNSFNIRGIGKTENNSSVGVGVITYRDGVAVFPAYLQNEPFFDIASLEVLRGPQGTFAGQNATGGAVFITERNPDFGGLGGYVSGQYGNYNDIRLQGAINLPLTETLAARLAFNSENRDSFFDVQGTPSRGDDHARRHRRNRLAGRRSSPPGPCQGLHRPHRSHPVVAQRQNGRVRGLAGYPEIGRAHV